MLRRAVLRTLGSLVIAAAAAATAPQPAHAADVIKIGTLAPKASPWGQVFSVWEKAVKEKSGGRLELQFFYNGQQGDEAAMVGKMKSGQLHGAAVTSIGLSKIYKPILALQLPGLFSSWAQLDRARDAMKAEFEKGVSDAGFRLAGWGDVGIVYFMSKGVDVKAPANLQGKKPYMWRDDPTQPALFQVIGGVTPVPLNVPEVLPQLNIGAINVVMSSALAAEQLQWSSKLDTILPDPAVFSIGAVVLSSKQLDALPADLRQIVLDTGKVAASALTTRIRNEDAASLGRLKPKMTVLSPSADDKAKWAGVYKQTRQRLAQGTFSPELVTKLEGLAN
ncbi:MAG: TRAP transporter substrate-binding protein DctP [Polyangia bacterium]